MFGILVLKFSVGGLEFWNLEFCVCDLGLKFEMFFGVWNFGVWDFGYGIWSLVFRV